MWRCATLRERRTSTRRAIAQTGKRFQHALALQLDYYMSPQFAGVASALVNDTYKAKGIDISFLPTCPVGHEQANMRKFKDENPSFVTMGSVEQNIFSPTLAASPHLKTTAVAAMFRKSPLCIASLKDPTEETLKIGTHEDTVDMMKRIFPTHKVIASPRATKNTDLMDGNIGATQAYTTTEVPALQRALKENDKSLFSTPLEGFGGAKLGYSQVIFTADECLKGDQRDVVRAFCEATFDGWKEAIRNPKQAAEMVADAKKMLGLDDESNDHWHPSFDFEVEMLQNCNDHVKETFEGDRYGVINPNRWNDANSWILNDGKPTKNFGLDPDLWHPNSKLLSGNSLSNTIMEDAKASATFFKETHGRKPSLAVVTVGDLERYKHGERRLEIFSNSTNSWFSKTTTGLANGFDVQEINLDSTITTDELLSQIYALGDNVDGIQLMWPLPDHIDSTKVYSAIDVSKDVDGIHYVGQREIGNKNAYPPVTPAAAMALMNEFDVKLKGKRVLVVGRSRIVGSPLAHMIREQGAAVTVAHSEIPGDMTKQLVEEAQVIVACAGQPGLIKADWINQAQVINIGSTFDSELEALRSDIEGDIEKHASRFSPVPGGVGPISVAMLLKNVVKAAWDNMSLRGSALRNGWNQKPGA